MRSRTRPRPGRTSPGPNAGHTARSCFVWPSRNSRRGAATRFAVLYAYSVPGTISRFAMLFPQPGIEVMGHDRGSRNRYSVNVFTAGGAPAEHCTVCSPGVFGRVTHRSEFASGFVRNVRAGVFGAYVT